MLALLMLLNLVLCDAGFLWATMHTSLQIKYAFHSYYGKRLAIRRQEINAMEALIHWVNTHPGVPVIRSKEAVGLLCAVLRTHVRAMEVCRVKDNGFTAIMLTHLSDRSETPRPTLRIVPKDLPLW